MSTRTDEGRNNIESFQNSRWVNENSGVSSNDASLKRKSEEQHENQRRTQTAATQPKCEGVYLSRYCQILNDMIEQATGEVVEMTDAPFEDSQFGIVQWTGEEKAIFFAQLDRFGQDAINKIAEGIGSKTELEVRDYLQHLQEATKRHRMAHSSDLLTFPDFPAASEISESCCDLLEEKLASRVRSHMYDKEIDEETAKYGSHALLNMQLSAKWDTLRTATENGDAVEEPPCDPVLTRRDYVERLPSEPISPAFDLLDLTRWLELSYWIFMNRGAPDEEDHWHNIAPDSDGPSIVATAFVDFYNLTVSLTKRLVSTCLFLTASRLRATGNHRHGEKLTPLPDAGPIVEKRDVLAAVDILRLQQDSRDFWWTVPQRYNLRVHDMYKLRVLKEPDDPLTYDRVKVLLQTHRKPKNHEASAKARSRSRESSSNSTRSTSSPSSSSSSDEDDGENDKEDDQEYIKESPSSSSRNPPPNRSNTSASPSPHPSPSSSRSQSHSHSPPPSPLSSLATTIDTRQAHVAEHHLWRLLNRHHPTPLPAATPPAEPPTAPSTAPAAPPKPPPTPPLPRASPFASTLTSTSASASLSEWRTRLTYHAPWATGIAEELLFRDRHAARERAGPPARRR